MIFESFVAFRIRTERRPSTLEGAGNGLFALEAAPRGKFLGLDIPDYSKVRSEEEILRLSEAEQMFSWRHMERICFKAHKNQSAADFLNHSYDPNILWHVGSYFAWKDIAGGDELFLDYRYLWAPSWGSPMVDSKTGRALEGFEWREALLHSSRRLVELLEGTSEPPSGGDGE